MEQYLDEKDGKWHITMWVDIPNVVIRNKLNFRVHSILNADNITVNDPHLNDSSYIFHIPSDLLGKRVFFNSAFSIQSINAISAFTFGLCDENVMWHQKTFQSVNNAIPHYNVINKNIVELPIISEQEDGLHVKELGLLVKQPKVEEQPLNDTKEYTQIEDAQVLAIEQTIIAQSSSLQVKNTNKIVQKKPKHVKL